MSPTVASNSLAADGVPSRQPLKSLDKNAFLQLLVAQLKNQDPFVPQDTNDFLVQLAQFSILEQLTSLSQEVEHLRRSQELAEAAALLGKTVRASSKEGEGTGTVEKVSLVDGEVKLTVGGRVFALSEIVEVLP